MFTPEKIAEMRACLHLLPEPGGEVVGECLDEIERYKTWPRCPKGHELGLLAECPQCRVEAENERLREALDQIAESQDRGRYDGHPEPGPAYDEPYTPWLIARQALSADGEPVE